MIKTTPEEKKALSVARLNHKWFKRDNKVQFEKERLQIAHQILDRPAPKFGRLTLTIQGFNQLTW